MTRGIPYSIFVREVGPRTLLQHDQSLTVVVPQKLNQPPIKPSGLILSYRLRNQTSSLVACEMAQPHRRA